MIKKPNGLFTTLLVLTAVCSITLYSGCKKEDDEPRTVTYDLKVKDQIGISGKVTFTETNSTTTTIEITVNGGSANSHPAHIHAGAVIEGPGAIKVTLSPVDSGGHSVTAVTKLDDNTAITYDQLIAYDGYINVHESASSLGTIIAQADIGGNALTGDKKTYDLTEVGSSGISGTALFEKRKSGHTLVTLSLNTTIAGSHPTHIHVGSVTTAGPITKTFADVDGATGKSYTNIRTLDDASAITYEQLLNYAGYINVHLSAAQLGTIICQGNIGSND